MAARLRAVHRLMWSAASRGRVGLKLQDVPSVRATPDALRGKTVAIDAPNLLYAFYAVRLLHVEPTREARDDALRAATRGLLQRVQDLSAWGARPVVVLEGPPHPLKRTLLAERDATRAVPAIGAADYLPVADAVRAAQVPVVTAPHDAEAQACAMASKGLVDVVATTDWDALAMGAPALLRNLSANPGKTEGRAWSLVHAPHALGALGLTRERLAAVAVLMGCDYFPGFPRVGPKKASRLLGAEGPMESAFADALRALGATPEQHAHAHAALRLLVDPPSVDCDIPRVLKGTTLDRFA